jgi:hypothetical protein
VWGQSVMTNLVFTSILGTGHREELERLLFFNQNQDKFRTEVPPLIERYGMARVKAQNDGLRVVLDSSPEPQTLYMVERFNAGERLFGVMVYLREGDTLSLVIAAAHEEYRGPPLVWKMVDVLCDIARRVKGIRWVTVFPGTQRERRLLVGARFRSHTDTCHHR